MIKQTLEEWKKEGTERYGESLNNWKFKCPSCGHVATGADFVAVGADANDMYQTCIGRHVGEGVKKKAGTDEGFGCEWAAFGLFKTMGKGRIVGKSKTVIPIRAENEQVTNVAVGSDAGVVIDMKTMNANARKRKEDD